MPVTLSPITCGCGRLVGYTARGGPQHQSTENRDPYEWVATVLDRGSRAEIVALMGFPSVSEMLELRRKVRGCGYLPIVWDRASGKKVEVR